MEKRKKIRGGLHPACRVGSGWPIFFLSGDSLDADCFADDLCRCVLKYVIVLRPIHLLMMRYYLIPGSLDCRLALADIQLICQPVSQSVSRYVEETRVQMIGTIHYLVRISLI